MKDMMGLMKQAQAMQQKMTEMQAELDRLEVEGQAGGGMVRLVATAKGQMRSITIDQSLMNPAEKEILEDLIVTAANDARAKAERMVQERMSEVTKGLALPPGMRLF